MELVVKTYPGGKVSGFMDRLKVRFLIDLYDVDIFVILILVVRHNI